MEYYIYKLTSKYTDKVYYGSTKRSLCQRMQDHKTVFINFLLHNTDNTLTSSRVVMYPDAKITLMATCPVSDMSRAHQLEAELIEQPGTCNLTVPAPCKDGSGLWTGCKMKGATKHEQQKNREKWNKYKEKIRNRFDEIPDVDKLKYITRILKPTA